MAASDKKINAFIFLYVVLPLFVVLALVNAGMFNDVLKTKSASFMSKVPTVCVPNSEFCPLMWTNHG